MTAARKKFKKYACLIKKGAGWCHQLRLFSWVIGKSRVFQYNTLHASSTALEMITSRFPVEQKRHQLSLLYKDLQMQTLVFLHLIVYYFRQPFCQKVVLTRSKWSWFNFFLPQHSWLFPILKKWLNNMLNIYNSKKNAIYDYFGHPQLSILLWILWWNLHYFSNICVQILPSYFVSGCSLFNHSERSVAFYNFYSEGLGSVVCFPALQILCLTRINSRSLRLYFFSLAL